VGCPASKLDIVARDGLEEWSCGQGYVPATSYRPKGLDVETAGTFTYVAVRLGKYLSSGYTEL
jgi:hypothetical protein